MRPDTVQQAIVDLLELAEKIASPLKATALTLHHALEEQRQKNASERPVLAAGFRLLLVPLREAVVGQIPASILDDEHPPTEAVQHAWRVHTATLLSNRWAMVASKHSAKRQIELSIEQSAEIAEWCLTMMAGGMPEPGPTSGGVMAHVPLVSVILSDEFRADLEKAAEKASTEED